MLEACQNDNNGEGKGPIVKKNPGSCLNFTKNDDDDYYCYYYYYLKYCFSGKKKKENSVF